MTREEMLAAYSENVRAQTRIKAQIIKKQHELEENNQVIKMLESQKDKAEKRLKELTN